MKGYFVYKLPGGCGIPKITLEGTLTDWLHLQEKVAKLRNLELDLDFWLDRIYPRRTTFQFAGFLGARQDIVDGECIISPVIGWYVTDRRAIMCKSSTGHCIVGQN
ncbi:hypothetical protein F8M41_007039 [Gigaspora margarita]|uniref:Uncharacterized protein n=1 Tax=Gigaspora margarita TaxID=4874 RepID=A0A8H4EV39_GIGMA|nr:hypothetical protein F8M41_007039 [Gigaspora margarita]